MFAALLAASLAAPGGALAKGGHGSSSHAGHGGHGGSSNGASAVSFAGGHRATNAVRPLTAAPTAPAATRRGTSGTHCAARDEHGNCVSAGARAPQPRAYWTDTPVVP